MFYSVSEHKDILIVRTKKNNLYSLKIRSDDGKIRAVHSLYDPETEAKRLLDSVEINEDSILLVLGLGLGYHIREFINRYPNIIKIIIVECNSNVHKAYKKYGVRFDVTEKIEFIIGHDPGEVINKITEYQIRIGMLPIKVFALASVMSAFPDYYKPIYHKFKNTASSRLKEVLSYSKLCKEKLRICLLDFGYFLRKEIFNAIKSLGHEVVYVTNKKDDRPAKVIENLLKQIIEKRPDIILTVNHLGFDEGGILTAFLESIEMPVAVWYVDSPNIIVCPFRANISDNTVLFLWDWSYRDDMASAGFKNIFYLPLATDETIFKPLKISKKAYRRYYSKVSFVGNSMVDVYTKQIKKVPETFHEIVETLAEQLSEKRMSFTELLSVQKKDVIDHISELPEKDFRELESAVYWRASMLYRWKVLKNLVDFSPVIYGDEGWKKMIGNSFQLEGSVNYYETAPIIYNSTEINFNATSLQMPEAVNQRVFDVPACGAFLLTDHQKAIEELFEVGKEVVTYKEPEEVPELVRYYLRHPEERQRIALAARKRVLSEHTYVHRIENMIKTMRKIFS